MKITSKAEFFRLWEAGVLGNRTRLWRDPIQCWMDCCQFDILEVGFRELGKAGGGHWEKVHFTKVMETAAAWKQAGHNFVMDDGAPDDKRTLCGEVCRTYRGLEGILGVVQCPMRIAMQRGLLLPRSYATVNALLDRYMDASSRDDLEALLELYPDATVEFSCFTVNVGIFPARNTIFWETRDY